jgi:hypothetical protein
MPAPTPASATVLRPVTSASSGANGGALSGDADRREEPLESVDGDPSRG